MTEHRAISLSRAQRDKAAWAADRLSYEGFDTDALREAVAEWDAATEPALDALRLRLVEELDRYGIHHADVPGACALDSLLRHIYNNRDTAYGAKDRTIRLLEERLAVPDAATEPSVTLPLSVASEVAEALLGGVPHAAIIDTYLAAVARARNHTEAATDA